LEETLNLNLEVFSYMDLFKNKEIKDIIKKIKIKSYLRKNLNEIIKFKK
jgi:hypothetical protein